MSAPVGLFLALILVLCGWWIFVIACGGTVAGKWGQKAAPRREPGNVVRESLRPFTRERGETRAFYGIGGVDGDTQPEVQRTVRLEVGLREPRRTLGQAVGRAEIKPCIAGSEPARSHIPSNRSSLALVRHRLKGPWKDGI